MPDNLNTMQPNPILYETHMHTPLCKHAYGRPEEYAAMAQKRKLKGIIVTCHNPTNESWGPQYRMRLDQFEEYLTMVEEARQTWAGRIDVRLGLESDYAPGMEAWLEELHSKAEFHYILGSVHPDLPEYKARYFKGDIVAFQKLYFEHLAMAAETGLFDALSHPDLVKNAYPNDWQLERLNNHLCACLDRIAAAGTAMELNTSGLNKAIREMNPGLPILREMQQRHIPVVIGADAHKPERVAADFEHALGLLQEAGYSHVSLFLNRKRQEIETNLALRSLWQSA